MILTNTIDLLVNRSTHYVVLSIISVETGCSFLLEQFPHLPFILLNNIGDSSVAPQVSVIVFLYPVFYTFVVRFAIHMNL